MYKSISIITLLLITGCTSTTGIYTLKATQTRCEKASEQFLNIFECTKLQLNEIQQNQQNPEVTQSAKLYLLKGEQLKEKVLKNEVTDLDAKNEWQKLYVELDNKIREFQQRAIARSRFRMRYGCMRPTRFGCW